jgi:ubiquitin-conjugating enzyme E2 J1
MSSYDLPRSRDWVCQRCNRSNLECLPDPAQLNDASTLGSVSEAKTSSEAEVVPTPAEAEVVPPQPQESKASVPEREANPGGVNVAPRSESDDTTSDDKTTTASVVASSQSRASSAPTPSQNISDVHVLARPSRHLFALLTPRVRQCYWTQRSVFYSCSFLHSFAGAFFKGDRYSI